MTSRAFALLLVVLLLGGLPGAPSAAAQSSYRQFWQDFALPSLADGMAFEIEHPTAGQTPLSVGGVRIPVFDEEHRVTVWVLDDRGARAAANAYALDAGGRVVVHERFCRNLENWFLPLGVVEVWVLPSANPQPCNATTNSIPTTGTVYAFFPTSSRPGTSGLAPGAGWLQEGDVRGCTIVFADADNPDVDHTTRLCADLSRNGEDPPAVHVEDGGCPATPGWHVTAAGSDVNVCTDVDASDPDAEPWLPATQGCGGFAGTNVEWLGGEVGACAGFVVDPPSTSSLDVGTESCPETGLVLTLFGGKAGFCGRAGLQGPNGNCILLDDCVGASLTDCGPQEQVDPVVYVFGGAVWACGSPVVEPVNDPPFIDVDLSPCQPQAADPAVYIEDGVVQVCVVLRFEPPTPPQGLELDLAGDCRPTPGWGVAVTAVGVQACIGVGAQPDLGPILDAAPSIDLAPCAEGVGLGLATTAAEASLCAS